jgi:hypothetical protein
MKFVMGWFFGEILEMSFPWLSARTPERASEKFVLAKPVSVRLKQGQKSGQETSWIRAAEMTISDHMISFGIVGGIVGPFLERVKVES